MTKTVLALFASSVFLTAAPGSKTSADALLQAIRAGNSNAIRAALTQGADVNAPDADGDTPLMLAAMYADAAAMKLLIERGADVKAVSPAGAGALHRATASLEKVRMLVERGADVNQPSKMGKTPLMIAASRDGAGPVVAYLVEHGAKVSPADSVESPFKGIPLGGGGTTALAQAAKAHDGEALAILLRKGADVNAKEKNGSTPLHNAIASRNRENALALIAHGADVNAAMVSGTTPLSLAAMTNQEEVVAALLAKGAKVDAEDAFGYTALSWAAYSDLGRAGTIAKLLDAGASLNHKSKLGETPLTLAMRRGETAAVKFLKQKGAQAPEPVAAPAFVPTAAATTTPDVRTAITHSLPLLQKGGAPIFKERGCVSCHNNMLPVVAASMARDRGHRIDEQSLERERKTLLSMVKPQREMLAENGDNFPDIPVTVPYALMTLSALNYPADGLTDAAVYNLANKQKADGSWTNWAPRPPMEFGDIQATVLSMHSLQIYPIEGRRAEFDARIRKTAQWLAKATPATTEEEVWRTLGLVWSKGDRKALGQSIERLKKLQQQDGGWAQLAGLKSDAYATGLSLYALHEAGVTDRSVNEGVAYLLRTQAADGTWQVKSRSVPLQPYFESGFPYGPDQWISMAGSSWAAIALCLQSPAAAVAMAK